MARILITGGGGFVGKHLVGLLKEKNKVIILSRNPGFLGGIKGDLNDYDSIKDSFREIDTVIHLAFSKNYPENIKMTENLIRVCKENKVQKIILLSSMAAKRNNPDQYGKVKQMVEKITKQSGINYTILRPSIIYGRGSSSFDFIIDKIRKIPAFVPVIGSGKYKLAPVYILDVVEIIKKCVENKITDKKEYDLPGGEEIYFIDLIEELKKQLRIKKRNIKIPIFMCKIVASTMPSIISKENIKNLTESSIADIDLAKNDLDYKPVRFWEGAKDGLL